MLKSLSVPERLFQLATWLVSLLFAGFLIGLGGKVVGDLPGVDQSLTVEQFMAPGQASHARLVSDSLVKAGRELDEARDRASLRFQSASNRYNSQKASFDAWIATRVATTDPAQDPEVLGRTRDLDQLKLVERRAQADVEQFDAQLLRHRQSSDSAQRVSDAQREVAQHAYDAAWHRQELKVFGIRLALTLPLLLVAAWLVMRKRRSEYWPLARGFVLFAAFTFFVELVPYLPSYGGYVRYGVGVVATALGGIYLIRAMQRYMARRAESERRSERERRQALGYEEAIKKVTAGICPGCERPIVATGSGTPANFCGHCGMTLFDECRACHTRKNAFFHYCPACGVEAAGTASSTTTSTA